MGPHGSVCQHPVSLGDEAGKPKEWTDPPGLFPANTRMLSHSPGSLQRRAPPTPPPELRSLRGSRPLAPASELREGRSGETEARICELGALIPLLSVRAPLTKPEAGTLFGGAAPWPYTVLSVRRPPFSTACLPKSPVGFEHDPHSACTRSLLRVGTADLHS